MNSVILQAATRILVPLLLMFSVFMLLRGHNAPGGGFIGGLIGATSFVVYSISNGTREAREALRIDPEQLAVIGLGTALCAGLISAMLAQPFLSGQWLIFGGEDGWPEIALSSVLLFDIGVYLVVMGAILTIVFALEEEI